MIDRARRKQPSQIRRAFSAGFTLNRFGKSREDLALGSPHNLRGFARFQDLVRLSAPEVPQRKDGRQVPGAGTSLPRFPVIDRLPGCADEKAAFSC